MSRCKLLGRDADVDLVEPDPARGARWDQVLRPTLPAATATCTAAEVLPEPPFGLSRATVFKIARLNQTRLRPVQWIRTNRCKQRRIESCA